jgi:serine/threonine protein kinase/tetratricopeptide (TPR) repeat protein
MIERIAYYELLEMLGSGGMGVVFRARDTKLDREVALKLLPEHLADNPAYLQRFEREARAASALNHPNICIIYEIGEHQSRHYISMELLDGQTLRTLMQSRPLPPDQIIRIALQIADALEAAHSLGLIHRDIKPANIFITQRGFVKILDFGLAKLGSMSHQTSGPPIKIAGEYVSTPHTAIGTLPYMSPEQALGEELDRRTDLFSLGSLLYELSTGTPAFKGNSEAALFQEILTKHPKPPRQFNPDIPPRLEDVIWKLLEKDRELRYQTAADVCADLKRLKRDLDLHRGIAMNSRNSAAQPMNAISDSGSAGHKFSKTANGRRRVSPDLFPSLRKSKTAFSAAGIIIFALALSAVLLFRNSMYYPCIEFEDFIGGSESVDAQLVGFVLKRTLSQFPELTVVDHQEFDHLLTIEKARKKTLQSKTPARSIFQKLIPWKWGEMHEPAIRISGQINDSLGLLEVKLTCVVRGKTDNYITRYRGVDELLNKGIDAMVLRTLNRYDPQISEQHIESRQPDYRTAVQLLSPRWDALRHYFRGAKAWERYDMNLAERELRSASEIDPNLALAHLALGEVRVFQNQWDAAQSEILLARKHAGALTEVDQWCVEAYRARVFGIPFEERGWFQKLIGLQPYKKEYLYELAESYFHTADVDEAIPKYQDALSLDGNYGLAYNHLAYCYAWKGEHARALAAWLRYLDIDGSANAYDSLGDAYMLAGNYSKAAEMKTKAIQMDPQLSYASCNLAYIAMMRGRYRAAAEYLKSMAGTPDKTLQARHYAAVAFLNYRMGNLNVALKMCQEGLKIVGSVQYDAPHDELIWLSGIIELDRHDLPSARNFLSQLRNILNTNSISAMNYKPAYKYYQHLLARTLVDEGRYQEALAPINDLKWIRSKLGYWSTPYDFPFFFDAIGQIFEKMKQLPEAEQAYKQALEYNPHYALARYHLALMLNKAGEAGQAQKELELFWADWQNADADAVETLEARKIMARLNKSH